MLRQVASGVERLRPDRTFIDAVGKWWAPAMKRLRRYGLAIAVLLSNDGAHAQPVDGGSRASAEQAIQAYLAMWSSNADITAANVDRFYAPEVTYYGKRFSRAEVLADKQAYIRAWPVRSYREVPGTFAAKCNADRSLCRVSVDMVWRRAGIAVSSGKAHMMFDFVPTEGARKIARESARNL